MNKPNPVEEPSMEEILASIRRIISDGEEAPSNTPGPMEDSSRTAGIDNEYVSSMPAMKAVEELPDEDGVADDEILDLTEEMSMEDEAEPVATEAHTDETQPDMSLGASAPEPREPEVTVSENRQGPAEDAIEVDAPAQANGAAADTEFKTADQLLSPAADAHVSAAFGRLAHTILSQDARTLDDLVQEMLRPMLKEWLDDNLPQLVERLVRAEIERVSRGKP